MRLVSLRSELDLGRGASAVARALLEHCVRDRPTAARALVTEDFRFLGADTRGPAFAAVISAFAASGAMQILAVHDAPAYAVRELGPSSVELLGGPVGPEDALAIVNLRLDGATLSLGVLVDTRGPAPRARRVFDPAALAEWREAARCA